MQPRPRGETARPWLPSLRTCMARIYGGLFAARQPKRSDPARVRRRSLLEIIPDVPDGAIVHRIDRRLGVILPPQVAPFGRRPDLRCLAFDENGLGERQHAGWIVGGPAR